MTTAAPYQPETGREYAQQAAPDSTATSNDPTWHPDPRTAAKLPLLRPLRGRWIAGVCRGVSLHLGVPVAWIRVIALALCAFTGAGAIGYVLLWILVPTGNPEEQAQRLNTYQSQSPVSTQTPLSRGNRPYTAPQSAQARASSPGNPTYQTAGAGISTATTPDYTEITAYTDNAPHGSASQTLSDAFRHASKPATIAAIGVGCLFVALLLWSAGGNLVPVLCVVLSLAGIAIPWMRLRQAGGHLATTVIGMALVFLGYALVMVESALTTGTVPLLRSVITGLALVLCVAAAVIPWVSSLIRDLGEERALKEREEERADMTAHLHDGVLQTLVLIQSHADDAGYVASLARSQERELRNWLYQERVTSDRSVSAGLREVAAEAEDTHGVAVDVVTVGDAQPSEQTDALLDAAAQAIVNALTHGKPPIAVYCEASENLVEIDVRDHGDGFDPQHIPEGRLGIRESIIGRVQRRGGNVTIVSRPEWGTEVRMTMPMTTQHDAAQEPHAAQGSHNEAPSNGEPLTAERATRGTPE
ncbi:ATP-binding protein [Bifidobacterium gallicum]|nr:ATP-binding protein [Bifidobacterium gallicum]